MYKLNLNHLPQIHKLKILTKYYDAVLDGRKKFEIRKNDRDFRVGDMLILQEYKEGNLAGWFTGEEEKMRITYITDYAQKDGYVVLGIEKWEY